MDVKNLKTIGWTDPLFVYSRVSKKWVCMRVSRRCVFLLCGVFIFWFIFGNTLKYYFTNFSIKIHYGRNISREAPNVSLSITKINEISKSELVKIPNAPMSSVANFTTKNSLGTLSISSPTPTPSVISKLTGHDSNYIIRTETCRIPAFDPRDASVLHAIQDNYPPINCGKESLTSVVDKVFLIHAKNIKSYEAEKMKNVNCCYQSVIRGETDNNISLSAKCTPINNGTVITEEYIRVECLINENREKIIEFHYTIPDYHSSDDEMTTANNSNAFNVMVIGFDSTSRINFQRHLQKTSKYLLKTMGAIEMFGYTKSGDNTLPNFVPVLTGLSQKQIKSGCWKDENFFDDCSWIWQKFSAAGYTTLYGEDTTYLSTFNYQRKGFNHQPTDYYLRPFYLAAERETARIKFHSTKLCLGSKLIHELTIDWAKQFMEKLKNSSYFGIIWTNSLTHDDSNTIQLADNFTTNMLHDLYEKGALEKTILIMMGDHGMRWGPIRETLMGRYENRLPALYIYLPQSFKDKFPERFEALKTNSRRLTTTFDLYHTFLDILQISHGDQLDWDDEGRQNPFGGSLFSEVPENRTCEEAGIDSEWCACDEMTFVNVSDPLVTSVASFVLTSINNIISSESDKCAELTLNTIRRAARHVDVKSRDTDMEQIDFRVEFDVHPSGAIFESTCTVEIINATYTKMSVEGDVVRMNLYGNQSYCVDDAVLKSYCYCL